ncbi:MAG: hypothetical protein ABI592_12200 [Acidobacteriota bacterium]
MVIGGRFFRALRAFVLALIASALPATAFAGLNEWTSIGPYGPGGNVRSLAIDPSSTSNLYAGTDGGVFKSVNGGVSWGAVNHGMTEFTIFAIAVDPQTPATVYAATSGGVFKSVNAGNDWSARRSGLGTVRVQALAIDSSNPSVVYAGTRGAGVFKSTDGGTNWVAANSSLGSFDVRGLAVSPASPGTVVAATASGVFRSTDAAGSWSPAGGLSTSSSSILVDPTAPSVMYAGADGLFTTSGVFKSTDSGATWAPANTGLGNVTVLSLSAKGGAPSTIYAGTQGAGVFVTTDAGATWKLVAGSPSTVSAVAAAASGASLYAGTPAGFFRSADAGTTWRQEAVAFSTFTVNSIVFDPSSSTTLYAGVGRPGSSGGGVFKTTNAGASWVFTSAGLPDSTVQVLAVDPASPVTLYAGTASSGVYRSRDGGTSWIQASGGLTSQTVFSLAAVPGGTVFAGTANGVFRSTDGGTSWAASSDGLSDRNVQALAIDPTAPSVLYAGTTSGVFKSSDGADAWTESSVGLTNFAVPSLVIDPSNHSTIYAGTVSVVGNGPPTGSGVYRSTNGGASWAPANTGIQGAGVTALATTFTGGTVYAGTGAGVFRTSNGGASWSGVNEGLSEEVVDSVAVDPRSPGVVYAGTIQHSIFQIAFQGSIGSCTSSATTLCLNNNRFRVEVEWNAIHAGTAGNGMAIPLTTDTGAFWFFTSGNVELVIKVVDGRTFNGAFWVFYGALSDVSYTISVTDTTTGVQKIYQNPQSRLASVADTSAFPGAQASAARPATKIASDPPVPAPARESIRAADAGACAADGVSLCLNANRFRVTVNWAALHNGTSGVGQAVPLTSDTGSFWFFSSGNLELNIKVVDGRAVNNHFWVFYGALSDVQYTVTVTDTETGAVRSYTNPQGRLASVADTSAF